MENENPLQTPEEEPKKGGKWKIIVGALVIVVVVAGVVLGAQGGLFQGLMLRDKSVNQVEKLKKLDAVDNLKFDVQEQFAITENIKLEKQELEQAKSIVLNELDFASDEQYITNQSEVALQLDNIAFEDNLLNSEKLKTLELNNELSETDPEVETADPTEDAPPPLEDPAEDDPQPSADDPIPAGSFEVNRAEYARMVVEALNVDTSAYNDSCATDVQPDEWYTESVCYLVENNLVSLSSGTSEFGIDEHLNRAEAAKFLFSAFELQATSSSSSLYPDVDMNDWYGEYVNTLGEFDIYIVGAGDLFRPADNITNAEADYWVTQAENINFNGNSSDPIMQVEYVHMLVKAANIDTSSYNYSCANDVSANEWYTESVCYLIDNGIASVHQSTGEFGLMNKLNRAEASKFLYQVFDIQQGWQFPTSIYPDVDINEWYSDYANVLGAYGIFMINPGDPFEWEEVMTIEDAEYWVEQAELVL